MSSDAILSLIQNKAELQSKVAARTLAAFDEVKKVLAEIQQEISRKIIINKPEMGYRKKSSEDAESKLNSFITLPVYTDKGDNEAQLDILSDTIIYVMRTHIFSFDNSHPMWKTSYIEEEKTRSFCGSIYVYNFLSDSFKYERENDIGYLIARIFINSENHFFVEGKKQMGILFNDFINAELKREDIRKIVEATITYSLEFDPFNPPYDVVHQISVKEIRDTSSMRSKIATGKRLGFRFSADKEG